jgi:hypothetical protein
MRTTILAYVIAFAGLVTLGLGLGSLAVLVSERAVPLRHYAAAIGMISGGLGLGGLARFAPPSRDFNEGSVVHLDGGFPTSRIGEPE